ncbi:DUF262 domain-containing protein [Methanobrevibacter sp.]|uniref:GmrSD restriction endonuclease domain-containing protein n=1 Tax=Methanobrevibacter sp. TaxID=66852 RepID=UPI00389074FD
MAEGDVFSTTNLKVSNLVSEVDSGIIALPDLQRPFVWKDKQIRDLFDSLYRGLPTGLIILWGIGGRDDEFKPIGFDKPTSPNRLVIDGQQRLTSLYTVFTGKPVLDKNYKKRLPKIAFNPLTDEIEVLNSSREKNPEWINNITEIFSGSLLTIIREYISNIKEKRPDLEINETEIENKIEKIRNIRNYPFSVIELSQDLNPEQVSEIFVRINSKGKVLNESDFILTLMSVYWDDGRKALEEFTKDCKKPDLSRETAFTTIKATPDLEHLLRPAIAYSFLRGRLHYAYLILKGRNLENKTTTEAERNKNFDKYKKAQEIVLNLTNWHDYCNLIESIGFINYNVLISSEFAFYACYGLYLIGKYQFNVEYSKLNRVISKWFAFSQLTQRYSSSSESIYEQDLVRFREKDVDFVETLDNLIRSELTADYWNITLPQRLISSSNNYAGKVYTAAKIFEGDNMLFSKAVLRDHLSPLSKSTKKSVDIHHIFPKNYLINNGITDKTDYNQQANKIYIEYKDNIKISDKSPAEYWPLMLNTLNEHEKEDLMNNYIEKYDLPYEFWNMDYFEFLEARRKLMAKSIKKYFEKL